MGAAGAGAGAGAQQRPASLPGVFAVALLGTRSLGEGLWAVLAHQSLPAALLLLRCLTSQKSALPGLHRFRVSTTCFRFSSLAPLVSAPPTGSEVQGHLRGGGGSAVLCCTIASGQDPSTGQQHSAGDPSSLELPASATLSRAAGHWSPVTSGTEVGSRSPSGVTSESGLSLCSFQSMWCHPTLRRVERGAVPSVSQGCVWGALGGSLGARHTPSA